MEGRRRPDKTGATFPSRLTAARRWFPSSALFSQERLIPERRGIRLQSECDCVSLSERQGAELGFGCHFLLFSVKHEEVEPQNDGLFLLFAQRQDSSAVSLPVPDSNVPNSSYGTKKLKDMKVKIVFLL